MLCKVSLIKASRWFAKVCFNLACEVRVDVDVVAKQTSEIFSLVRPKVDAIYEDTALAGLQMGQLLIRRIAGEAPENLQILHVQLLRDRIAEGIPQ